MLGWELVCVDSGNTKFVPLDLVYYPWSHSLLVSGLWATAFIAIYYRVARYMRGALLV